MKRLLQITTVASMVNSFLLPFATHFRNLGWQVDAMAKGISEDPECVEVFDRVWEVEWSRNPLDLRNFLVAHKIIQKVMHEGQYDIVHVHSPVAAFVSRYALNSFRKQGKCQVIYTAHGFHFHPRGNALKNTIFLTLEKLAGAWTDHLVVINRVDELAAKKYQLLPTERIHYMPGIGVDLDYYNGDLVSEIDLQNLYWELGISAATPLFICVAEFIPRKHHSDIIHAFAKLVHSKTGTKVCLAFAGQGVLLREMQQLAMDLGIGDRIYFLGLRKDIPTLMKAAVANILVSDQEGLPRSIMESLSLETPTIGTQIRGIQELLEAGCGLLVEVGDVEDIARKMAWILEHPQDAKLMGKRGRELMKSSYALPHIIKLHEDLYMEILSSLTNSIHDNS